MSLSPYTVRGRIRSIGTSLGVAGQLKIAAVGRKLFAASPSQASMARPGNR
jgi:hypothetical protein